MADFYFGEWLKNAKFATFSSLQNFLLYGIHVHAFVHEFCLSLFNGEMYVSKGKKLDMHTLVFFNFYSLLSSSLSSFVSLPSPLLSLRLELTERQLLLTRTALDNALKDLNQMKYISLCLSSFTLLLLIPLFLCLLVLIFFFHCFTFLLLFFFYFLFLFSFFYFRETMRELTTSNTDADATMETGVEERDSYYSNYAHHGIHEEMLKVILHCV